MTHYTNTNNPVDFPKTVKDDMNDRIRELAMQADIWCDQNVAQGSPMYNNQWEYKFAELIIRDVLAQVEEIQRLDNVYKTKVGIDFEIDVSREVLKNYGVE